MFFALLSLSVWFSLSRWYITSSWQKYALKTVISCQQNGGSLYLFTLRGRLHVTSPSFLHSIFFNPYLCVFHFSFFSFFSFSSLNIIGAFSFFVFLSLCFSYFVYLLSFHGYLSNNIIIIYNILISFVCAYMCAHARARQRLGKIRHKNRATQKSPYNLP